MKTTTYRGELWQGKAVAPELWKLLLEKDLLIELAVGNFPYRVILGVPHHAAPGVDRIAEKWKAPGKSRHGRAADETTGLTGLAVLQALSEEGIPARLVIAAHAADHDPNKTPESAYWQSVFAEDTLAQTAAGSAAPLLFELHGAGKRRLYDLELSAGSNQTSKALSFGTELATVIPGSWQIAVQTHAGSNKGQLFHADHAGIQDHAWIQDPSLIQAISLENPALETGSLTHAGKLGIPALHLEMKSFLRQPDENFPDSPRPTREAWVLARAIATTIKKMF
jgi:hypothetical protein